MELRQLEYYAELCKTRNFTKASENLNVAQPSVTKAVQKLEEELGTELVIRTQKPLGLTKAGERFYERTTEILELLDTAVAEASGVPVGNTHRAISLGIAPMSGIALDRMLMSPEMNNTDYIYNIVRRSSVEIITRLQNKELDLGWVIGVNLPPDLAFIPVEKQEAKCLLPPNSPLADRKVIRFADLKDEPFAMALTSTNSAIGEIITQRCREAGFRPKCAITTKNFHPDTRLSIKWIREGVGLGFIPEHVIEDVPDLIMPAVEPPVVFEVGIAYRRTSRLPLGTKQFIEFILENYPRYLNHLSIINKLP